MLLLLTLLIKAKIQIKFFSALGIVLLLQTLAFLAAAWLLGTAALGALTVTHHRQRESRAQRAERHA